MTTTTTRTVGRFSFDASTNTLTGPADYMAEQGDAFLARAADSVVVRYSIDVLGNSPVDAILVALQTDYAGWLGMRQVRAVAVPAKRNDSWRRA